MKKTPWKQDVGSSPFGVVGRTCVALPSFGCVTDFRLGFEREIIASHEYRILARAWLVEENQAVVDAPWFVFAHSKHERWCFVAEVPVERRGFHREPLTVEYRNRATAVLVELYVGDWAAYAHCLSNRENISPDKTAFFRQDVSPGEFDFRHQVSPLSYVGRSVLYA